MVWKEQEVLCIPGQRLCEASGKFVAGNGTYILNKYIYASLMGKAVIEEKDDLLIVRVSLGNRGSVVPDIGSIVTCKVLSVNSQMATVSILAVESNNLHTPFQGCIKKQNVREYQVDAVEMYKSFRPDDIVLAKVMSLGSARNYELTTAANELGVVTAFCEERHKFVPISWTEMKCVCKTEKRKVAQVVPPKESS